jgi:hypothetical protein
MMASRPGNMGMLAKIGPYYGDTPREEIEFTRSLIGDVIPE